jgi:putative oxidoreductase
MTLKVETRNKPFITRSRTMSIFRPASPRQLNAGLAVLRLIVGTIFVAHGGQKLFVHGLEGVTAGFAGMGIPLAGVTAPAVAFVELLGGIALVLGLLTRPAAVGLAVVMAGAVLLAHLPAGFFLPNGYEFALALLGSTVLLALTGAGTYSLDAVLQARRAPAAAEPAPAAVRRAA